MNLRTFALMALVLVAFQVGRLGVTEDSVPGRLPAPAEAVLKRMDSEIVASKLRAVTSLEKILADTTKKGDLEGAMAIKKQVDRLKGEVQALKGSGPNSFVGRWRTGNTPFAIDAYPDGRVTSESGLKGRWTAKGPGVEILWENGVRVVLESSGAAFAGQRIETNGASSPVTLSKVGAP